MSACRSLDCNWFNNRCGFFTQAMQSRGFPTISFNCCCSESIFHVAFLFFSCTRTSVWLFNCAENNMGSIVYELKSNLEAASLVSHVLGPFSPDFCQKKIARNITKCIWCIENSPESVYLPAVVETCEKKICMMIGDAFLSRDHWFVKDIL